MGSATIKDVANKAGVSVATVSYVLNGTRRVKPETRAKVEAAIDALLYSPNPTAQRLRGKKSKTIGFITPSCSNAFYSSVFSACDRELRENNYHILIANSAGSLEMERTLIRTLCNGIVDGLIIFTVSQTTEDMQKHLPKNIPCIILDTHFPSPVDSVTHSFSNALQEVVYFFKRHNHTKIALFTGLDTLSSVQEQYRVYRQALEAHGLPFYDDLYYPRSRFSDKQAVLTHLTEIGCNALCFIDFNIFFDTFYDAKKRGFNIPKNFDVVCGSESPMDYLLLDSVPRIITPTEEIGQIAAQQILFRLKEAESGSPPLYPQRTVIPCVVQYPNNKLD